MNSDELLYALVEYANKQGKVTRIPREYGFEADKRSNVVKNYILSPEVYELPAVI